MYDKIISWIMNKKHLIWLLVIYAIAFVLSWLVGVEGNAACFALCAGMTVEIYMSDKDTYKGANAWRAYHWIRGSMDKYRRSCFVILCISLFLGIEGLLFAFLPPI